jgi:hypothetical protein
MGGVGSRSKEGWGEARLGKEVQMLSGLSDISDLTSVGVGGWMETGGAVRSSSPSVPFSKQSWRLSRNLKAVRWVLSDVVLSDYTFVRPNVDRQYWLSDKNQGANVDQQGFISTYKHMLTDGY